MPRKPTGKPNGKPPHKPTPEERKTVSMMSAVGLTLEEISKCIRGGIDIKTLMKHYREELDTSKAKANAAVGGAMYNKAIAGDVSAQKYWLGCRAKWKEGSEVAVTVEDKPLSDIEAARKIAFALALGMRSKENET